MLYVLKPGAMFLSATQVFVYIKGFLSLQHISGKQI